jgi:hypothetical protein
VVACIVLTLNYCTFKISCNRGDTSFSDKSQVSQTTNTSSLATAVSDSANVEGVELVAGRCHAQSRARKYNNRWVICTGPRTCKRAGNKGKKEKGVMGKPGLNVAVYNKGGGVQGWRPRKHSYEREGGAGTSRTPTRGKPGVGG